MDPCDHETRLLIALAETADRHAETFQRDAVQKHRDGQILDVNYSRGLRDYAQVIAEAIRVSALLPTDQRINHAEQLIPLTSRDLQRQEAHTP